MDLTLIMYTEIDILCILLVFYIGYKSIYKIEKRRSWQFFVVSLFFIEMVIGSDLIWALMEGGVLPNVSPFNYIVNCIYFLFSILITECWFLYTEYELNSSYTHDRNFLIVGSIPFAVMLILLIISYSNGCIFRFDEQGKYVRGPFAVLSFVIPCLYLIFSTVHATLCSFKKENYINRRRFLSLAGFAFITALACGVQLVIPGTPIPCIGITCAVLLVYMSTQDLLVSLDPLTKFNNRNQMVRHLSYKMDHANEDTLLYLLIVDMDGFKQINDTHGHVEGDKALIDLAAILMHTAAKFNCFVSRYGGDEFILIHEAHRRGELEELCDYIHESIATRNKDAEFKIGVSLGAARYSKDIKYVPDFIAKADKALYEVKREKKKRRIH